MTLQASQIKPVGLIVLNAIRGALAPLLRSERASGGASQSRHKLLATEGSSDIPVTGIPTAAASTDVLARVAVATGDSASPFEPIESPIWAAHAAAASLGEATDAAAVVRWADLFAEPYPPAWVMEGRLVPDVLACLASCVRAVDAPGYSEGVARLLQSAYLLEAVEQVRQHVTELVGGRLSPDDEHIIDLAQTLYVATLRKACLAYCVEPETVLMLLLGHAGCADTTASSGVAHRARRSGSIPSYARHLISLKSLTSEVALEFAGALDAAFRSDRWPYGERAERAKWRKDLLLLKGYGRGGSSNVYSALALVDVQPHKQVLLSALDCVGLVPDAAECREKRSLARARELERALLRRGAPDGWPVSHDESAAWLRHQLAGRCADAELASLRARYEALGRDSIEQAAMLAAKLADHGLDG